MESWHNRFTFHALAVVVVGGETRMQDIRDGFQAVITVQVCRAAAHGHGR